MKKVIFETLKAKNFFSIGKSPVILDFKKGFNIITGTNKDLLDRQNGIGKSTLVDAFYFAIFGETTRDLKKEFILNNITNETSEVYLSFSIDSVKYEIIRTIKPSKCSLYENEKDISRDSIANTTEHILSILNLTPEIFSNCICLSINSTIPFMAQKKLDKKKFIEGIFNLNVFTKMNSLLKEEYNAVKKDIETTYSKYTELGNSIKIIEDQNKKVVVERDRKKQLIFENISKYEKELEVINDRIAKYDINEDLDNSDKVDKLNVKKKDINSKIDEENNRLIECKTKIKILNEAYLKIGTDKDECPICLKPVSQEDVEHLNDRKKNIKDEIEGKVCEVKDFEEKYSKFKKELELTEKAILFLNDQISKNKILIEKRKNDLEKNAYIQTQVQKEKKMIEEFDKESVGESKNIEGLIERYNTYDKSLKEKKEEFKILDNVKFVLSEEGVKTFVIKKIMALFNSKIAFYLKELNSNAVLVFDEYFEESIKNERGKETMYFNYSSAERKAIDLAVMFSFIDMLKLQTNVYYNVQFYDELLDTSLDSVGVENVVKILNDFVEKNSYAIYVISHRKECTRLANGEIVFLEKENGITKRNFDYTMP
jgi:DNA repair exonuclease SbcCD ATPase subunit